jgi:hypothetical protein
MRVVVHHTRYYEWVPLPPDAKKPTEQQLRSKAIKPSASGGYFMRVAIDAKPGVGDHTLFLIPEQNIAQSILEHAIKSNEIIDRSAAAYIHITRIAPHHFHRSWVTKFEVEDSGPEDVAIETNDKGEVTKTASHLEILVTEHNALGNVADEDVGPLMTAYLKSTKNEDHEKHLTMRFGLKGGAS